MMCLHLHQCCQYCNPGMGSSGFRTMKKIFFYSRVLVFDETIISRFLLRNKLWLWNICHDSSVLHHSRSSLPEAGAILTTLICTFTSILKRSLDTVTPSYYQIVASPFPNIPRCMISTAKFNTIFKIFFSFTALNGDSPSCRNNVTFKLSAAIFLHISLVPSPSIDFAFTIKIFVFSLIDHNMYSNYYMQIESNKRTTAHWRWKPSLIPTSILHHTKLVIFMLNFFSTCLTYGLISSLLHNWFYANGLRQASVSIDDELLLKSSTN